MSDRDPMLWGDLDLYDMVFRLDNGEDLPVVDLYNSTDGRVSDPLEATYCRCGPRSDGEVLTVEVDAQDRDEYRVRVAADD